MFTYERKVNYYETDQMGVVHHSNYIRWMEEARVAFLEEIKLPFQLIESRGIFCPVVAVSVNYKKPSFFGDTFRIEVRLTKFNGIRFEISYTIRNIEDDRILTEATSRHCFTKDGRACSLKKVDPELNEILSRYVEPVEDN